MEEAVREEPEISNDVAPPISNIADVELSWNDVHLAIKQGKKPPLTILKGVDGIVRPTELVAILGSSGAGKTSLLNTLAGRLPSNGLAWGSIKVNGQDRDKKIWPYLVGYVEQFELFFDFLTVRETLTLASHLRMKSRGLTHAETHLLKIDKVQSVINELGLNFCVDRKLNQISGGERKRVSIAIELIAEPSILFLDEPTSGLDAFTALTLLQLLRNIAKRQRKTILLTIHQPRFDILEQFDKIILLAKGRVVYNGPVLESVAYFSRLGKQVPPNTNPSDYFIDLITIDTRTPDQLSESQNRVFEFQKKWIENKNDAEMASALTSPVVFDVKSNNLFVEMGLLLQRNLRETWRNKKYLVIVYSQLVVLVLLLGLVFLQLGNTQADIQSRAGVLFFIVINAAFLTMSPFLNIFPAEKQVIIRERRSRAYRGVSSFFAKVLSTIPQTVLYYVLYCSALYWMIGLNPNAGNFFIFMLIVFSLAIFATQFGLAIGAIAPNQQIAQVLGPTSMLIFIVFGGNFSNPETIPGFLAWMIWISPIQYAYKAAFQNEFEGQTFTCDTDSSRCLTTGEEVIDSYNLESPGIWACILILWGITVALAVFGAICLEYKTRTKYILILPTEKPDIVEKDDIEQEHRRESVITAALSLPPNGSEERSGNAE